jgi:hypothetical protein
MTMRAALERNTNAALDEYGQPGPPNWTALATVPAWWWTVAEREVSGPDKTAVFEDARMIVPRGTDVTEQDRVAAVRDRRDVLVRAGPLRIESVVSHRDHLELVLQAL